MSTATMSPSTRLSFPRLVRSEWIKLRSIRSTIWCFTILALLTVGMSALLGAVVDQPAADTAQPIVDGTFVQISTAGVMFTALVVGVLGALIITGEYGTGQIRSTFTADPGRTGAVLAKAVVLAVATFVVSAVATWVGALVAYALQTAGADVRPQLTDPAVFMPILGSAVYVTLVALLAFGIGLLVRSSAGGIAIALGILLVLPVVLNLLVGLTDAQWAADLAQFVPSQAGGQLYAYDAGGQGGEGLQLNGWSGFLVLLAEVVVVNVIALTAARTRDV